MRRKGITTVLCAAMMSALVFAAPTFAEDVTEAVTESVSEAASSDEEVSFELPIILTSAGQSADVDIADTLCKKAGIDEYMNATISADEVTDQYKTLIIAVGGSSKGLGAAGIDADEELERVEAVIEKAKEEGLTILAMHTGGSARRGTLSDKFLEPVFSQADAAIVVSEGDQDNAMKDIIDEAKIDSYYIDNAVGALEVLQTLFAE